MNWRLAGYIAGAHLIALVAVWGISMLTDRPTTTEEVWQVKMVSLPEAAPPAQPTQPVETAAPRPPTPAPAPAPAPVRESRPTPAPRPRPTPTSTPKPKPQAWKANSASDIRNRLSNATQAEPVQRPTRPAPTVTAPTIDTSRLANQLNTQINAVNTEASAVNTSAGDYASTLASRLQALWEQPTTAETGGRNLGVTVRLTIRRDGTVVSKKLITPSNVAAMDTSVRRLLFRLNQAPAFPAGMQQDTVSLDIVLRVRD